MKVIQLIWHTIGWLQAVFTHKKSLICLCRLQQGRHFAHLIFPPFFFCSSSSVEFSTLPLSFKNEEHNDRSTDHGIVVHCKAIYFLALFSWKSDMNGKNFAVIQLLLFRKMARRGNKVCSNLITHLLLIVWLLERNLERCNIWRWRSWIPFLWNCKDW